MRDEVVPRADIGVSLDVRTLGPEKVDAIARPMLAKIVRRVRIGEDEVSGEVASFSNYI